MAPPALAAGLLLQAAALARAEAGLEVSYTHYPGSNAYTNFFGHFGGQHLDHCDRTASTLQECQDWCSQDCECHCLVVWEPNGACFRRHSCETGSFEKDSRFSVYVKDNFTGDCSKFEDMGFHTECEGPSLQYTDVSTVESLEDCKLDCAAQNFECTGIQFMSDCRDSAANTCRFFNSTITSARTSVPTGGHVNSHCLKYRGPVGDTSGTLTESVSVTIGGINGAALLQDAAATREAVGDIKDVIVGLSPNLDRSHVRVDLRPGSLVADIQVERPRDHGLGFLHDLADRARAGLLEKFSAAKHQNFSEGHRLTIKKWKMTALNVTTPGPGDPPGANVGTSTNNATATPAPGAPPGAGLFGLPWRGPSYAILALGLLFVAAVAAVLYCVVCGGKGSGDEDEDSDGSSDGSDVSS